MKGESELLTGVNEERRSGCLKAMALSHGPRSMCLVGQEVEARSRPSNGDGAEGEAATGFCQEV